MLSTLDRLKIEKDRIEKLYNESLMYNFDQVYRKNLQSIYNNEIKSNNIEKINTIILQSKLNVRLLELEPLSKIRCDEIKRDCEFQNGFYDDLEYKEHLKEINELYFCKFKFVIGIDDFKVRIEMAAIIGIEDDIIKLINHDSFDGNIMVYFNDIKIDSRELQGNSGPSEDMIYSHFSHIFTDKDYFIFVYMNIIDSYMKSILK